MEEQVVNEEKKLTGLAAYHEKQRLEKEQKNREAEQRQGIRIEKEAIQLEGSVPVASEEAQVSKSFKVDPSKMYHFVSCTKSSTARNEMIGNTCLIFDPVQNRTRKIMYIPFADTIYVDEMGERYAGVQPAVISIYNNHLDVPGTDARLVEYLLAHDQYEGNKNRLSRLPALFTLLNKEDVETGKEAWFSAELRAMNIINDTDIKDLLPVARVVFNIIETDALSVKNRLREFAKKDPSKIITNIDNPRVTRGYLIQAALDHGVLEVLPEKNSLVWGGTGVFVTELRAVRDAEATLREITDFTFTKKGGEIYDILRQKVKI